MINGDISKIQKVANKLLLNFEECFKASNKNEFSDEDFLMLHSVFGTILDRALNVFEKYPIIETYSTQNNTRMLIEVKGDNDRRYRIFPRINYCPCLSFKHRVVVAKSQITCKHVLAARIAVILGKTANHEVTQEQYRMLVQSMFETQA